MNRDYPSLPMVGILALVRRGDRFLLVRRAREPNQGRWGFPGGVQELGETVIEAAQRELAEETRVTADGARVFTALDAIDRDDGGRIRYHYTLIAVLMDWVAGEGEAGDDAAETGWYGLEDIEAIPTIPAVARLMIGALEGSADQAAAFGIGPT
jgi:ADP-ribose pyrophosphatase YjhB (NUDIX family)